MGYTKGLSDNGNDFKNRFAEEKEIENGIRTNFFFFILLFL